MPVATSQEKRFCTIADITVKPDYWFKIDADGEPTGERINYGGEHVYYCNNCGDVSYAHQGYLDHLPAGRLEYLRGEIEAERISTGEIVELQSLVEFIPEGDTLLLEWAGVPE